MRRFLVLQVEITEKNVVKVNYTTKNMGILQQIALMEAHKQKLIEQYNKKTKNNFEVTEYGQD